jgi:hypothetical protein
MFAFIYRLLSLSPSLLPSALGNPVIVYLLSQPRAERTFPSYSFSAFRPRLSFYHILYFLLSLASLLFIYPPFFPLLFLCPLLILSPYFSFSFLYLSFFFFSPPSSFYLH